MSAYKLIIGKKYLADLYTKEFIYGDDARGTFIYKATTTDIVTYPGNYNETGIFDAPIQGRGFSYSFYYDPAATSPHPSQASIIASPTADYLDAIDRLQFDDGLLIIATDGVSASIFGLYDYLGRAGPEGAALQFWLHGLEELGLSLQDLARDFIRIKAEAASQGLLTADPASNRDFVALLYRTFIGQEDSEEAMDFWVQNLDNGAADRGDVLADLLRGSFDANAMWFPY